MKKLIVLLLLLLTAKAYSTTFVVQAGGFSFSPNIINNAHVGDSIKWVWVSGFHTTTSTSVPAGALTWDFPLNAADPSYTYKITMPGTYNYQCTNHVLMGMTGSIIAISTGIERIGTVAEHYELSQNFPNPFNPSTNIKFSIPERGFVSMNVYDITGKLITNIVNQELASGTYTYQYNASDIPSGIYFYRIQTNNFTLTRRMTLIK
jgi:plastocyanin